MSSGDRGVGLRGRRNECDALDRLLTEARAGHSGVLVVRGEAGIGKSALLDFLLVRASGCRVVRASGVESEMELAFAGLHQLCAPMLNYLERLPGPQRDALRIAFGQSTGEAPDRFLVGLAVLSLLAEVAEEVCVYSPFVPGDLQLLNNHVIFHGRTAYEDDSASHQERLLLRLWLSMPNSRRLPRGFETFWGAAEPGALRGGVIQQATGDRVPLNAA